MSDIKSISHQSIHSTQSAPAEGSQKNSEIVKEYKPAEFRPLSNEQKESIKLTRNAENKFAESAIRAKTEAETFYVPDDAPKEFNSGQKHVFYHEKKSYEERVKTEEQENKYGGILGGVADGFNEIKKKRGLSSAAGSDIVKKDQKDFVKAGGPQDDIRDIVKRPNEFAPIQTGPIAEYNSAEPVLKAEKFFPSIRFEPATPILDGEDEREEEPISIWAFDPLKTRSGNE